MLRLIRQTVVMLLVLSVVTGLIYPLAVTGIAQLAFHRQANGTMVVRDGKAVGSELIGQPFSDPRYFWSRPSATTPFPYNAANSGGSNLGPLNPALRQGVEDRVKALHAADPAAQSPVPVDLVTSSASGLDPDISVAAAQYQAPRVAKARGLSEDAVGQLVERHTRRRDLNLLGEPRVNVLELNLALDGIQR